MLRKLIDNNYVMTDKGKEIFDEFIEYLLDNYTVFREIDEIAFKIIKNRRSYHVNPDFNKIRFGAIKYMIYNEKNLKNLILALMSCWSLRGNSTISESFYDVFNSTFNWIGVEHNFNVYMRKAYNMFSRAIMVFRGIYPEFKNFEEIIKKGYNVFYDIESYEKLHKKIDRIVYQKEKY